jgi:hypothetical protein
MPIAFAPFQESKRLHGYAWFLSFALILCLSITPAHSQVNVLTQHNDIGRTGQNTQETTLTPQTVTTSSFGKLFSDVVDGTAYAQPLYMSNVATSHKGVHNVVFVATENDSVYAFDADNNGGSNGSPLWKANLAATSHGAAAGATAVSALEVGGVGTPVIGITGTPVIDPVAGTLYVVSFTSESSNFVLRLHALDITNGAERTGSPTLIQASVAGTGSGSSGGTIVFDPKWELQRPGLLLLDGTVYVGFAAYGDNGPWHGWILAYDAMTMKQVASYCASPEGVGAGFWMSGAGLAADLDGVNPNPQGRIYAVAGNGDFNATTTNQPGADYGDSVIELSLHAGILAPQDSFTPEEQAYLNASDGDLGSGGALVIPDTAAKTHLLLQSGKEGKIYLLDRDNLGGYNTPDKVVQELANGTTSSQWGAGVWGIPAYWNNTIYFPGRNAPLSAYSLIDGLLSTSPVSQSAEVLGYPAPSPSISANGKADGVVWLLKPANSSNSNAVLEAYDAANLANLLYSSITDISRDGLTIGIEYNVPTVANGKVYAMTRASVAGSGAAYGLLNVFGLFNGVKYVDAPVLTPGTASFKTSTTVTITDATPGAAIYYTTDGTVPSAASTLYTGPIAVSSNETISAIGSATGYLQSPTATGTYTCTTQVPTPHVSPLGGVYYSSISITITDSSSKATIYYTTDGSIPTTKSTQYTVPFTLPAGPTTINAIAVQAGFKTSEVFTRAYQVTPEGTLIDFSEGFANSAATMQFNGSTDLDDTRLQLTNGGFNEAGSAFYKTPVEVNQFTTDFSFQLSNPVADGITFTLQGVGPTALGSSGAGLGYAGIDSSLALKFDFFNDAGEGTDSTGAFVDGALPTVPAIDLSKSGINLLSDDTMDAHVASDGQNLYLTITDIVTNAVWSTSVPANIPSLVGGNEAYVGFTGSTNATDSSSQKIETWHYQGGSVTPAVTATPHFSLAAGTYATSQTVTISDSASGSSIYYTLDNSNPSSSSTLYAGPITVAATETIRALAIVTGHLASPVATITYTIGTTIGSGPPAAQVSTTTLNYGSVAFAGTETLPLTITNIGGGTLTVVPSAGPNYKFTGNTCGAGVSAGNSCGLEIQLSPTTVGVKNSTLTLTTNGTANPTVSLQAKSTGVGAIVTALNFGSIADGSKEVLPLTIENEAVAGSPTLTFKISGPSFEVLTTAQNTCMSGIATGSTCVVPIQFDPVGVGPASDLLTVTSSSGTISTVSLKGAATAAP